MDEKPQIMRDASDYYKTERCFYPTSPNLMLMQNLDRLTSFDAFAYLDTFSPRPLLFIVGSLANTRYFSQEAFGRAAEPKEMFVIEGTKHVDLYDGPQYVNHALGKLTEFFKELL